MIVIAKVLPTVGPYLEKLLKASFALGIFHEHCRKAKLLDLKSLKKVPVPSSGSVPSPTSLCLHYTCFQNYCILLLSFQGTGNTGSWTNNRLPRESGLLNLMQTIFRKFNSSDTALFKLTGDILMGIDKNIIGFIRAYIKLSSFQF